MLDVNNLNTTGLITNLIDNVSQRNTINNGSLLLLSPSTTTSSFVAASDTNSSVLLTDFVVNTTAAVVEYAANWLTTTLATTHTNLTSFNNETFSSVASPSDSNEHFSNSSSSFASSYLNFTIPSVANMTKSVINSVSNQAATTSRILSSLSSSPSLTTTPTAPSSFSTSATTYNSNTDLIGDNPKFADGSGNFDGLSDCHPNNPNFNCSRMEYILSILGPQTLPLYTSLIITILYGGIFITGFLGNILVCVVIVKHTALHTATNYYLFNLAVADLIYLVFGLPTEVFSYWHQYPYLFGLTFCKARAYISEASTYASVLTIVAFSVERYLAICHPLHKYALSGFKRALRIIALLWVVSFVGAIPFVIWTKINYWNYPPDQSQIVESGFCGFDTPQNIPLFEVSSLVFFFIPMFLIFYFYGRMGAKIYSRTTQKLGVQKGSMHRESRYQHSRKAVIRMLAAVVVTFFICWLPFHLQRLWTVHGKSHIYYQDVNEWLFKITGFAYYVTCTINPILYNVLSHRYRVAFKDILCGKRQNVYLNNGFSRDQSSFRETTLATTLYNSTYDRTHSVRVRSVRILNHVKDRNSINSNNVQWKKSNFNLSKENDIPENHSTNAVVVRMDQGVNGRTHVFTENEAQETLLNKNNETSI